VPPLTAVGGEVDVVAVGLTVPLHAVRTNPTVAKVAMPASRLDLRDIITPSSGLLPVCGSGKRTRDLVGLGLFSEKGISRGTMVIVGLLHR